MDTNPANPFGSKPAPTASQQPASSNVNQPVATVQPPAAKSPKKFPLGLVLGITIPAVVLVGVAVWYFAYFSNPYTVVRTAFDKVLQQRSGITDFAINIEKDSTKADLTGNLNYTSDGKASADINLTATSDGTSVDVGTIKFTYAGKDYYLKADLKGQAKEAADSYFPGVNNQWYKITAADIAKLVEQSGSASNSGAVKEQLESLTQCSADAAKTLDNAQNRQEVISALIDTKFVQAEHLDGDKYQITFDDSKLSDAAGKLNSSAYGKAVASCAKKANKDASDKLLSDDQVKQLKKQLSDSKPAFQLTITGFDRKLAKLESKFEAKSGEYKGSKYNITVDYKDGKPQVNVPSNTKSLNELLTSLQSGALSSSLSSDINTLESDYSNYESSSSSSSDSDWFTSGEDVHF